METATEKVEPTQVDTQAVEPTKVLTEQDKDQIIRELRDENAKRRVNSKEVDTELARLRELEQQVKEQTTKKLEEEGKFKELLLEREKELEALKPLKELTEKYESSFKAQFEEELKGLSETMTEMINKAGGNYAEKLDFAKKLKSEMGVKSNSPGAEAPGTSYTGGDSKALLESIRTEKDMVKKSEMIYELKSKNPQLYNQL